MKSFKKGYYLNVDTRHLGYDADIIEKEEILKKRRNRNNRNIKRKYIEKTLNYLKEEDIEINELRNLFQN